MSFVATYALGHVARRYYAGGRTLSTQMLQEAYAGISSEAQDLRGRYLPQMQPQRRPGEEAAGAAARGRGPGPPRGHAHA